MRQSLLKLGGVAAAVSLVSANNDLSGEAWNMVQDATAWMDKYYDWNLHQMYDTTHSSAMSHQTLTSAWYAVGLLARNGNNGSDACEADKIINYIIADQFENPQDLWYGDYTKETEEPDVGMYAYPPKPYASWDPNWRGFVGLSFVTIYEEFGHLLPNSTTDLMIESLYNCSVGDSYRGGGVNGDNLYPAYSNPSIMRAVGTGWTGRITGDANMTQAGEDYAQEIIDLFDMHNTLSEFNSPTYVGISLFGLTLWAKYMPSDSVMGQRGPDIVKCVFETTSQLWHADMRQLSGPWDRSYTMDMTRTLSLLSLFLAPMIGREESGLRRHPEIMSKSSDWSWAPLIAVHTDFVRSILPPGLEDSFKTFTEHTWNGQAYYPPYDLDTRNITTWLGDKMSIGAESYRCQSRNGPPNNQLQYNPAVVQWQYEGVAGPEIGWISVRSLEAHVQYEVSRYQLKITYPEGGANSSFQFMVSPSLLQPNVYSWSDIQGVNITVSGNANLTADVGYAGHNGGAFSPYYEYAFWRFEHNMTEGFEGVPELTFNFNM